MRAKVFGDRVFYREEVDSTQDWLRALIEDCPVEGLVCVAGVQSAGRGRRGRRWASPSGGLYLSFSLRWSGRPAVLGMFLALAVHRWMRYLLEDVVIKWPNDLYSGSAKLGGILAEGPLEGLYLCGIGVNVQGRPEVEDKRVISLGDLGMEVSRWEALFGIIDSVNECLALEEEEIYQGYLEALWGLGRPWGILVGEREEVVLVKGVDRDGVLITDKGEFSSAEVLSIDGVKL